MGELEGKVVLITGATRGIGKAIAEEVAKAGASVAFTYMSSDEKARELEQQLTATGIKAKGYKCDAADFTAVDEMVAAVAEEFETIDVLVNNAGFKSAEPFFVNPETAPPPPPPQPDPLIQTAMAEIQAEKEKTIATLQQKREEMMVDMQVKILELETKLKIEAEKIDSTELRKAAEIETALIKTNGGR